MNLRIQVSVRDGCDLRDVCVHLLVVVFSCAFLVVVFVTTMTQCLSSSLFVDGHDTACCLIAH